MTSIRVWAMAVPVAATALVFAAGADAQQPRDGEQIMNASCTSACHDATPIQTSAKDADGWTQTVERMIQMGATVAEAEKPPLIAYLARSHGPMPEGPGKNIVLNTCTICHDLTRVKRSRHSVEEWEDTLISMLNEGAPLSDDDFPVVLNYLAKNFGLE